ncbi:Chondramide synthase cmdD [compost metagenome]
MLKGISCCPGVVKEKVRVIRSPEDDMRLNGEILVAERTDPGWVPLYPAASGLLIERGSILSHSAIVARELGLPTIVGIKGLTRRVQDGQVVEMDARQGTVRL